jgi:hypothetical protein
MSVAIRAGCRWSRLRPCHSFAPSAQAQTPATIGSDSRYECGFADSRGAREKESALKIVVIDASNGR